MADETQVIVLGGRRFIPHAKQTIRFNRWMTGKLLAFGLDRVKQVQGESSEDLVERLLTEMFVTGAAIEFLAGLLLPEGKTSKDWTPEMADEQRDFIDNLVEPEDHALLRPIVAEMMIGFFRKGIASLQTSPTSSAQSEPPSAPPGSDPLTNSASGEPSSAS